MKIIVKNYSAYKELKHLVHMFHSFILENLVFSDCLTSWWQPVIDSTSRHYCWCGVDFKIHEEENCPSENVQE